MAHLSRTTLHLAIAWKVGVLFPEPEEARVVKAIFTLFLSGRGALSIAKELNADQIPTRHGGKWGRSSVEYLLKNERYMGDAIVQKRYRTPDNPHNPQDKPWRTPHVSYSRLP